MSKRNPHTFLLLLPVLLAGCYASQSYYVSPFNGNSTDYATIPLRADSVRSTTYGSAVFFTGNANEEGTDHFTAIHASLARTHNLGALQAWHGLNLTLGSFDMGHWDTTGASAPSTYYNSNRPPPGYRYLNQVTGNRSFGGAGFSGGMNAVWSVPGGEWRYARFETSMTHEFGEYLNMRRQMPDSVATLIVRSNFFSTLAVTTELVRKCSYGQIGWKWAFGWALGSNYNFLNIEDNFSGHISGFTYFDFTFHASGPRLTGFIQITSATKANAFHIGCNYRL
jgi:hypothetical protein